ncbi:hypothetical protein [Jeotgalibacillus haloalkalitolerans]|uniref:Uracil-DNA glycosylase-like domain-containing protein n=1 Tax=Jeotgalibacillus haloalkalitolerans TaxID=3104292 RepID=A0ABU5KMX8_9BACL|nr:hypothetical protein [Jeotgalibacillus sp. HH7-29]MDZ5712614.1 hypothetical protein [Jeotgalibacillus sp. HH7-29]
MINKALYQLYKKHWIELKLAVDQLPDELKPTHPLLLKIADEEGYKKAGCRIMIVGQETNDWNGKFGKYGIEQLQDIYADFMAKDTKAKRTLFWRYQKKLMSVFPRDIDSVIVWNNIYKLGKPGKRGRPNKETRSIQELHFNIFKEELNILKPDIVIFLTGPRYDAAIETYLPGVVISKVREGTVRQIAYLKHENLPDVAIRTYHPQYLNRLTSETSVFHGETPAITLQNIAEKSLWSEPGEKVK